MRNYFVTTPYGHVVLAAEPEVMASREPVVLLIHGAFRRPDEMRPLGDRFERVVYASLPGHRGAPELSEATMPAWVDAFSIAVMAALPRPVVVAGESLGGVLAMGLSGVVAAVAFDPFLRTSMLWPIAMYLTPGWVAERGYPAGTVSILQPGNDFTEVLQGRMGSLDVLASDQPLNPRRPTEHSPSLLDEAGEAILRQHGSVRRVPGTHQLVETNLGACEAAVRKAMGGMLMDIPSRG